MNDKNRKKGETKSLIEITLDLSSTIIKIVGVCLLIGIITGTTVITTVEGGKKIERLATTEQTSSRVTWVDSTELDENGNTKQVPVPKGFTASQIEGETTVSGGFVIYEGDVDWSQILVDSTDTEIETETETATDVQTQTETTTELEGNNENIPTTTNDATTTEEIETKTTEETTIEETIPQATQTEINIFNLQKSTNQYVWVPIDDPSELYGVDANGKLWGKSYNFTTSGRTANNWNEVNGIMSIKSATGLREPDVIANMTNFDIDSQLAMRELGQTRYELLAKELEQNFYDMIKSIRKYGGFYIGRYETGGVNTTAVVRKMNERNVSNKWYIMYKNCRQLGASNDNITTSMLWGTLWDATLEWLVASGATNSSGTQLTYNMVSSNSITWGNYKNATFDYITATAVNPLETITKAVNTSTRIPTGSSEYTKVNNIYDMAGNQGEWTLETNSAEHRVNRGGFYYNYDYHAPADHRYGDSSDGESYYGCRVSLLIK